jgi:hypothetical protein
VTDDATGAEVLSNAEFLSVPPEVLLSEIHHLFVSTSVPLNFFFRPFLF